MEVTFVKLLWTFSISLAGFARVGGYGGVGAGGGSFASSSSASFSGSAGGAGGGLLGGLFGGEGKLGLGNLQFSASLGGKDGGILGGGLFGIGTGGNFGFGGLGGGSSIDTSKDVYGESSVSFGGSGQGGSNERGPSGGYGYGGGGYASAGTTGDSRRIHGQFVSSGGSGQGGSRVGGNERSDEYGNGGRGTAVSFAGASAGGSTFSQITGGVDGVEYNNKRSQPSDATSLPKGNSESSLRGYGGHSTVVTGEFGGPSNCNRKIGCSGREVYASDEIAVSLNGGGSLTERDNEFSNPGKARGPTVFGGGGFVGSGSPAGSGSSLVGLAENGAFSGSASVGGAGSVSGGGYGKQRIQSESRLSNGQDGSFLESGVSTGGTVSVSGGNKEKLIEKNVGGNDAGGDSYSSTISGSGVGGLQFGAEIAAEIEKGPKLSIGNIFLPSSEKGALVTSEFEGRGSGDYVTERLPCSGSSCSQGWVHGDGHTKGVAASGGGGYGKQRIQSESGLPNGQDVSFLESGVSIGGTVSVSGGSKEKSIERNLGGNNGGGDSTISGSGAGGLQFGAEIGAEIEKGPKPLVENVFLQSSEKGALMPSEFERRASGGYVTEPKPCSGSSCSHGWVNGDGQTKGIATGGITGLSTLSFSGSGNVGGGKPIEREESIIYASGIGGDDSGLRHGNERGNGHKHHHGHGKKQKVIAIVDVDGGIAGAPHGASGFDGQSSINSGSNVGFDFNFGSSGNIGGGLFGILDGGGIEGTAGRGYGAEFSGGQAGVFDGNSKSCGGYGCGGQGGSEKTSIGISAAGASSFASASSGTGSYGYGR